MTENLHLGDIADIPAFTPDSDTWVPYAGKPLPALWISAPVIDDDGKYEGRMVTNFYPYEGFDLGLWDDEDFEAVEENSDELGLDLDGEIALRLGGRLYNEAMGCTRPEEHTRRIECFRAAELLYLHAAERDNPWAFLDLGYVYSYDRCEGKYFQGTFDAGIEPKDAGAYPLDDRSFECYERAAQAELPEAIYKLGDMYQQGRGCQANDVKTFELYERAFEVYQHQAPVLWGSAAIRLATCFEDGRGCTQDFEKALQWYRTAETGLDIAVRNGDSWYGRQLKRARSGVKRMRQEINGGY